MAMEKENLISSLFHFEKKLTEAYEELSHVGFKRDCLKHLEDLGFKSRPSIKAIFDKIYAMTVSEEQKFFLLEAIGCDLYSIYLQLGYKQKVNWQQIDPEKEKSASLAERDNGFKSYKQWMMGAIDLIAKEKGISVEEVTKNFTHSADFYSGKLGEHWQGENMLEPIEGRTIASALGVSPVAILNELKNAFAECKEKDHAIIDAMSDEDLSEFNLIINKKGIEK